jgi:hypothetical protein
MADRIELAIMEKYGFDFTHEPEVPSEDLTVKREPRESEDAYWRRWRTVFITDLIERLKARNMLVPKVPAPGPWWPYEAPMTPEEQERFEAMGGADS